MCTDSVDPADIVRQREAGWPDFHPEDYCHDCGRPNIKAWHSPEWVELVGSHAGILCPVCFAEHDREAIWVVTRWRSPDTDQVEAVARLLGVTTYLSDTDCQRAARCLVDAGWTLPTGSP